MNVIYDISAIGASLYRDQARTGIFRVVENVARELISSEDCDLMLCATASFRELKGSQSYLESCAEFSRIPFIFPKWQAAKKIAFKLDDNLSTIGTSSEIGLPLKVWRRVLYHSVKLLEHNFHRFEASLLPEEGIFHSPFYSLPKRSRISKRLKRFLTVYDLIPILAPQFFGGNKKHHLNYILGSLEMNDWILCISEATKKELCDYLKFDPARVFITYLAASTELFYPCRDVSKIRATLARYKIPDVPYILSLNTLEPRKNIDHAIRCFARLVREQHLRDLNFVLVGPKGWDYGKVFDAIAENDSVKDRIILTGYVADEDLAALYSGALAFVYPSFYEGFGLPPLEAMQCGVPVITSNTSSLPEVVGEAGIMLDPRDEVGLCSSLLELYENPSLRDNMAKKSLQQAQKFSWQKCAQDTISAYRVALNS